MNRLSVTADILNDFIAALNFFLYFPIYYTFLGLMAVLKHMKKIRNF